ncbi:PAS domain S-box-containing protein/diguanylate cyclase (GGDEF) domain-containing protein [Formivibrio citricus]|uniref:PAS domain S-box-containing protein/diguanylate cyclase (GGDEF) domain-containing protein n=1 Tax=Formivibrio citricus TaxID=83765 RepID=A0A1I4XH10_9NEIS|nr:EAL domain-containing protein [Formivibrio citricus]SFN24560.1 PAS domain S-box-containing protein/diguanylate cyclase (GGDEF) domain-containing protein [Formivibrio citricus]
MLSIRNTLILAFGGLILAVMIPLGMLVHGEARRILVEATLHNTQQTVALQSQRIAEWLDGNEKELALFSELDIIREFSPDKIRPYLQRKISARKDFQEIFYATPSGKAWSTQTPQQTFDVSDRDFFKAILKEQKSDTLLSTAEHGKEDGNGRFFIVRAIFSPTTERIGLLGASIRLAVLNQLVTPANFHDGYGWLIDRSGQIIAHPQSQLRLKLNVTRTPQTDGFVGLDSIGKRMLAGETGHGEITTQDGEKRLVVFTPVPGNSGWSYAQSIPTGSLFAPVKQLSVLIALTVCVALLGVIALVWALSRRISKPIELLATHTHRLSQGHFSEHLEFPDRTSREIRNLIDDFNRMAGNIDTMVNNLLVSERSTALVNAELASQQKALLESEERYRLAMDAANDILWDLDLQNGKAVISKRWEELHAFPIQTPDDWFGALRELVHPEDWPATQKKLDATLAGRTALFQAEFRLKLKNERMVWRLCRGKALKDAEGRVTRICGSISDIDEQKESHNKIRQMAFHDSLTGLPNRWYFMECLRNALAGEKPQGGALLFLNINNFKTLNDLFGHQEGDALLRLVASRLNDLCHENSTLARLGGDEFVMLLLDVPDEKTLSESIEGLLRFMRAPFDTRLREHRITVSIGVSFFPHDGTEPSELLRKADMALQAAKDTGRNSWKMFDPKMFERVRYRGEMEQALRQALHSREFELHYQPQLDIASGRILGFEALCRWTRPDYGPVSPAKFIPLAEETGHIQALGEWILKTACFQLAQWQRAGFGHVELAVNVSALQLKDGFTERLKSMMENAGITPERLEIEITESVMMQSFHNQLAILDELRAIGVRISLDDFGTGYSSLSYLRQLPIQTVKIDKSFIDHMEQDETTRHITESIISLSHGLKLRVVAEGVETVSQLQMLREAGCEIAQGYHIGKPMPPGEAEKMLAPK